MRLIDADELTKIIENDDDFAMNLGTCIDEHLVNGFYKGYVEGQIKIMQTAYNIDKVVEEIMEIYGCHNCEQCDTMACNECAELEVLNDICEIVKQGGVGKDVEDREVK